MHTAHFRQHSYKPHLRDVTVCTTHSKDYTAHCLFKLQPKNWTVQLSRHMFEGIVHKCVQIDVREHVL